MRQYKSLGNHDQKEKIVGGVLTLGQTLWIAGGFSLGLGLGMIIYSVAKWPVLAFAMIPAPTGIGAYLALHKEHGMSVIKFNMVKAGFSKQKQYILNCRPELMYNVPDYSNTDIFVTKGKKIIKKSYLAKLEKDKIISQDKPKKSNSLFSLEDDDE